MKVITSYLIFSMAILLTANNLFAVSNAKFGDFYSKDCRASFDTLKSNLQKLSNSKNVIEYVSKDPWHRTPIDGFSVCSVEYYYDGFLQLEQSIIGAIDEDEIWRGYTDVFDNFIDCYANLEALSQYYKSSTGGEVLLATCNVSDNQAVNPPAGVYPIIYGTKKFKLRTFFYDYEMTLMTQKAVESAIVEHDGAILFHDSPSKMRTSIVYDGPQKVDFSIGRYYFQNLDECSKAVLQLQGTFAECQIKENGLGYMIDPVTVYPKYVKEIHPFEWSYCETLALCQLRRKEAEQLYGFSFVIEGIGEDLKLTRFSL